VRPCAATTSVGRRLNCPPVGDIDPSRPEGAARRGIARIASRTTRGRSRGPASRSTEGRHRAGGSSARHVKYWTFGVATPAPPNAATPTNPWSSVKITTTFGEYTFVRPFELGDRVTYSRGAPLPQRGMSPGDQSVSGLRSVSLSKSRGHSRPPLAVNGCFSWPSSIRLLEIGSVGSAADAAQARCTGPWSSQ
jgi:hypothetical protein